MTHSLNSTYTVEWFTLALINAGLAQSKGRKGWSWGGLSLFFGPIITLVIVLLHPREKDSL